MSIMVNTTSNDDALIYAHYRIAFVTLDSYIGFNHVDVTLLNAAVFRRKLS